MSKLKPTLKEVLREDQPWALKDLLEKLIEFPKGKYKHFRKSITRPLKKWSPMKWFGYTHINKMLGCGEDRYISKLRFFKYIPRN